MWPSRSCGQFYKLINRLFYLCYDARMQEKNPNLDSTQFGAKKRLPRVEGVESRQRLLHAALTLFAERGFAKTSIRDIASAAQANVASISYYFGDKTQLYRCAFTEPMGSCGSDIVLFNPPEFSLEQALQGFFSSFTAPLKENEWVRLCTRLHMREMVEPTGLWDQEIDNGIRPNHIALVEVLQRHFKLKKPDLEIHRLAFSISALGVFLFVGRDVIEAIKPEVISTPKAIDQHGVRLVQYAMAMVNSELDRRQSGAKSSQP